LQYYYARQEGENLFGDTGNTAVQKWVVYRSAQIWNIFENANVPIVKVLPGLNGYVGSWNGALVSYLSDPAVNPTSQQPDVLAIAQYLNPSGSSILNNGCYDTSSVSDLLNLLDQYIEDGPPYVLNNCTGYSDNRPALSSVVPAQVSLAASNGMQLVAYEGGQHLAHPAGLLNNLYKGANRDPGMRDVMNHLMDYWFSVNPNGMFVFYKYVGMYSSSADSLDFWGSKEYMWDNTAPKWQALQDQLAKGN
jgi:hypothetical protein